MAGREVDRLGRREGLAIGISMNLGKTVPRVAGGVSVDRIIIEHANNLGHVSSFPHQGRIADTRRLLPAGRISGALRSAARRVGKECVSTCRSRWSPYPYKQHLDNQVAYSVVEHTLIKIRKY